MSSWSPTKYKTKNWPSYNTALKQRGLLSIWFDPEIVWVPPPNGKRGRQQSFSDAAIQACLTLKVLFEMGLRQSEPVKAPLVRATGERGCSEPVAFGGSGLVCAGFQHIEPASKDTEREPALSWFQGPTEPPCRQHGDQGRRRRRVECSQASWSKTSALAQ